MSQGAAARSCARSGNFIEPDRADLSVWRLTSDFRKSCQAPKSKIFRFSRRGKSVHLLDQPGPHEGRFAIVTMRWAGDAVDALASGTFFRAGRKRQGVRRSRVVL